MSDPVFWLALTAGEVVLVLLVVLSVAWFRHRAQRIRDRRAVKALVAWVERGRVERELSIRTFLADNFGLEGTALDAKAIPIAREETRLYQTLANLYLRRDAADVADLGLTVEAAAAPYWTLRGGNAGALPDTAADAAPDVALETAIDDGELDRLRSENEQLQTELQITMHTVSRMLNEFSAMFAGGSAELAPATASAAAAIMPHDSEPANPADGSLDDGAAPAVGKVGMKDLGEPLTAATEQAEHAATGSAAAAVGDVADNAVAALPDGDDGNSGNEANTDEASSEDLNTKTEIAQLLTEPDPADTAAAAVLDANAAHHEPNPDSDDASSELLADALTDADLALDNLDDLFDGISADEADHSGSDGDDEEESVAI